LIFLSIGGILAFYAALSLKENMKPSPKPQGGGCLVTSGLYGIVRHPAYAGIFVAALGLFGFFGCQNKNRREMA